VDGGVVECADDTTCSDGVEVGSGTNHNCAKRSTVRVLTQQLRASVRRRHDRDAAHVSEDRMAAPLT